MKLVVLGEKYVGKVLALPIYSDRGTIFIKEGFVLTEYIIKRIQGMGILNAYIEEEDSEGIVLKEAIEGSVKVRLIEELAKLYTAIKVTKQIDEEHLKEQVRLFVTSVNMGDNTINYHNVVAEKELAQLALHSIEVALHSMRIGVYRQCNIAKIEDLVMSAFLHDIGKLFTDSREHMKVAYEIIKNNHVIGATVFVPILHLHENIDGSGYFKIEGNKLYDSAQMLHIANNYVNLQKTQLLPHEIVEKIVADAMNKFEHDLFKDSMKALDCYPNGLQVRLNQRGVGVVVKQNNGMPTRPVVKINKEKEEDIVDLSRELSTFISEVIY